MTSKSKVSTPPKAVMARIERLLAKSPITASCGNDSVSIEILDAGTGHLELARQRLREGRPAKSMAVTVRRKMPTIIVKAPHKKTA